MYVACWWECATEKVVAQRWGDIVLPPHLLHFCAIRIDVLHFVWEECEKTGCSPCYVFALLGKKTGAVVVTSRASCATAENMSNKRDKSPKRPKSGKIGMSAGWVFTVNNYSPRDVRQLKALAEAGSNSVDYMALS